jgi:transposase
LPKSHPPYAPEFRAEALQLLRSGSRTLAGLSKDLGVTEQTLRNWRKQADIDEGKREGLTSDEREELRRLRVETRVLREERDILKKAAAFFVRETSRSHRA